jgi:Helix-turn-helix domain
LGVGACSPSGENPRVNDEPLLTEPEAAKVLRVSARTLKRWRLAGSGPPVAGYGAVPLVIGALNC